MAIPIGHESHAQVHVCLHDVYQSKDMQVVSELVQWYRPLGSGSVRAVLRGHRNRHRLRRRRRHRRRLEHRLRLHIIGPRGVSLNYICTCLSFQVTASACPPRLLPRRLEGHRVRPRPRPGLGIHIDLHLTTRIERHSTSACHSTSDSPSTSPPATSSEVSAASKITASASASASTSNK